MELELCNTKIRILKVIYKQTRVIWAKVIKNTLTFPNETVSLYVFTSSKSLQHGGYCLNSALCNTGT